MFGIFTEEEIRKLFFELADEMENECGNWENLPETEIAKQLFTWMQMVIFAEANRENVNKI